MVAQAIATARAAGVRGQLLVRGDSSYGTRSVVGACRAHNAHFSVVMTRNTAVDRAISSIDEQAWEPVNYPGAVRDPDTGDWISDAEVAEVSYTAFASTKDRFTPRLVVRRVKDARFRDALFPVWRYHPFFTNTDLPTAEADITHRQHAIIETVFADLIDGPLATCPQDSSVPTVRGCCARRSRTTCCAPPACSQEVPTWLPAARRCAARLSTFPPVWPDPSVDRSCTSPSTGLDRALAHVVAQHHRIQPTATGNDLTNAPNRPNRSTQEKLGRPATTACPQHRTQQKPHTDTSMRAAPRS
uniref:Putative transposase n=1 Tax=Mycolicibacterium fortuitum TaxID=1766 RepID=Q83YL6_MYCFO|nr:putative transposase [Mycolicibacterium fortuitum]